MPQFRIGNQRKNPPRKWTVTESRKKSRKESRKKKTDVGLIHPPNQLIISSQTRTKPHQLKLKLNSMKPTSRWLEEEPVMKNGTHFALQRNQRCTGIRNDGKVGR